MVSLRKFPWGSGILFRFTLGRHQGTCTMLREFIGKPLHRKTTRRWTCNFNFSVEAADIEESGYKDESSCCQTSLFACNWFDMYGDWEIYKYNDFLQFLRSINWDNNRNFSIFFISFGRSSFVLKELSINFSFLVVRNSKVIFFSNLENCI